MKDRERDEIQHYVKVVDLCKKLKLIALVLIRILIQKASVK